MNDWLELFNAYRAPVQHVASLLLAAAIWRWGGSPERWLAAVFVSTMIFPLYLVRLLGLQTSFAVGPWEDYYVLIDVVAAVLFLGVALNANRNYPMGIAAFQLVAVGAHMVNAVADRASPLAIAILVIGPSYFQLLLLLTGFIRHVRRERRFGPYRAWRAAPPSIGGLTI
ncbi:hypothetical protein [Erythrobacter oryzae]|uniref:hypothetical protein n=1 Tax=Erythrobacter oryzae TaxID=3019556 RepID=UPI0025546868|nr:hypothetical protein [Erythrobacter sp. COR-2]